MCVNNWQICTYNTILRTLYANILYNLKIIKIWLLGFWHGKHEIEGFENKFKQRYRLLNLNILSELQNVRKNQS